MKNSSQVPKKDKSNNFLAKNRSSYRSLHTGNKNNKRPIAAFNNIVDFSSKDNLTQSKSPTDPNNLKYDLNYFSNTNDSDNDYQNSEDQKAENLIYKSKIANQQENSGRKKDLKFSLMKVFNKHCPNQQLIINESENSNECLSVLNNTTTSKNYKNFSSNSDGSDSNEQPSSQFDLLYNHVSNNVNPANFVFDSGEIDLTKGSDNKFSDSNKLLADTDNDNLSIVMSQTFPISAESSEVQTYQAGGISIAQNRYPNTTNMNYSVYPETIAKVVENPLNPLKEIELTREKSLGYSTDFNNFFSTNSEDSITQNIEKQSTDQNTLMSIKPDASNSQIPSNGYKKNINSIYKFDLSNMADMSIKNMIANSCKSMNPERKLTADSCWSLENSNSDQRNHFMNNPVSSLNPIQGPQISLTNYNNFIMNNQISNKTVPSQFTGLVQMPYNQMSNYQNKHSGDQLHDQHNSPKDVIQPGDKTKNLNYKGIIRKSKFDNIKNTDSNSYSCPSIAIPDYNDKMVKMTGHRTPMSSFSEMNYPTSEYPSTNNLTNKLMENSYQIDESNSNYQSQLFYSNQFADSKQIINHSKDKKLGHLYCIDIFGNLTKWDTLNKTKFKNYGKNFMGMVACMTISPCKNYLIIGGRNGHLLIWSINEENSFADLKQIHKGAINSIVMNSSSSFFITSGKDRSIKLWSFPKINLLANYDNIHQDEIMTMVLSGNNIDMYTSAFDGTLNLQKIDNQNYRIVLACCYQIHNEAVNALVLSNDNNYQYSTGEDLSIKKWDLKNQSNLGVSLVWGIEDAHNESVKILKIMDGDRMQLSCGQDIVIKVWDVQEKCVVRCFSGCHSDWINTIDFGIDGLRIFTSGEDLSLKEWLLEDGSQIHDYGAVQKIPCFKMILM